MNDSQAKDAQMTQVEEATIDLQMRLTYQDDEIKQINRTLVRQQAHLAAMTQEISHYGSLFPPGSRPEWGDGFRKSRRRTIDNALREIRYLQDLVKSHVASYVQEALYPDLRLSDERV